MNYYCIAQFFNLTSDSLIISTNSSQEEVQEVPPEGMMTPNWMLGTSSGLAPVYLFDVVDSPSILQSTLYIWYKLDNGEAWLCYKNSPDGESFTYPKPLPQSHAFLRIGLSLKEDTIIVGTVDALIDIITTN